MGGAVIREGKWPPAQNTRRGPVGRAAPLSGSGGGTGPEFYGPAILYVRRDVDSRASGTQAGIAGTPRFRHRQGTRPRAGAGRGTVSFLAARDLRPGNEKFEGGGFIADPSVGEAVTTLGAGPPAWGSERGPSGRAAPVSGICRGTGAEFCGPAELHIRRNVDNRASGIKAGIAGTPGFRLRQGVRPHAGAGRGTAPFLAARGLRPGEEKFEGGGFTAGPGVGETVTTFGAGPPAWGAGRSTGGKPGEHTQTKNGTPDEQAAHTP